jgi:dynein heavy chain
LDESEPKKLFTPMPVIYVTALTSKEKKLNENYGQFSPYDCAVYKYPRRTDKYLVFRLLLKTELPASHWRLRGVSILCSTE